MKSKVVICAIAAATMGFTSLSFAQGYGQRGPDHGAQRGDQRGPGHNPGPRGFDQRDNRSGPHYGPRGFDRHDARGDRNYGARGPQFYRGGRIPPQYRDRQYVVSNWRGHHLHAPPRGQQWVQVGSDYALIAVATGVIAQLVLSR